jgi:hypothetical protein
MSGTRIYKIWANMVMAKTAAYEWKNFVAFYKDVGDPPEGDYLFSRPDVSRKHGPDNFAWVTRSEYVQKEGERRKRRIDGKTLGEWSDEIGIPIDTIRRRIRRGWDPMKAVSLGSQKCEKRLPRK